MVLDLAKLVTCLPTKYLLESLLQEAIKKSGIKRSEAAVEVVWACANVRSLGGTALQSILQALSWAVPMSIFVMQF